MSLNKVHKKIAANALVRDAIKKSEKEIQYAYRMDYLADKLPNIILNTVAFSCIVLHDKFGFGHDRLNKYISLVVDQWEAISNEYGDEASNVAMDILLEECKIDLKGIKQKLIDKTKDKNDNI